MAQERFMEFIGGQLLITAGTEGVQQELELDLPTSKTETMAMLIHLIELDIADINGQAGDRVQSNVYLSKSSMPSKFRYHGSDILAWYCLLYEMTVAAGECYIYESGSKLTYFNPPILIARDKLYLGHKGYEYDAVSTYVTGRIGYTLEKVSREAFIAALVD